MMLNHCIKILFILLFASNCYALETISEYSNETISVLNEELRKIDNNINNAVLLSGNQTISDIKNFTSSPIVPTPTTDYQASTKKYVDDTASFGNWTDKTSSYGEQQVTTNGFVTVFTATAATWILYTSATSSIAENQTNMRIGGSANEAYSSGCCPIPKNHYWKIVVSEGTLTSVNWIPLNNS